MRVRASVRNPVPVRAAALAAACPVVTAAMVIAMIRLRTHDVTRSALLLVLMPRRVLVGAVSAAAPAVAAAVAAAEVAARVRSKLALLQRRHQQRGARVRVRVRV